MIRSAAQRDTNIVKPFDTININAGGIALVLEIPAAWEDFQDCANKWSAKLGAKKVSTPIITADECLLEVVINGGFFWITYDDFQSSIQLEPKDKKYNAIILSIQKQLQKAI